MSVPIPIVNRIIANNFVYDSENYYTKVPAYVRRARNLSVNFGMEFYDCRILLEVVSTHYLVFKIVGHRVINDEVVDITRMLAPGTLQLIDIDNQGYTFRDLDSIVFPERTKYAL